MNLTKTLIGLVYIFSRSKDMSYTQSQNLSNLNIETSKVQNGNDPFPIKFQEKIKSEAGFLELSGPGTCLNRYEM